jgi:hypothetical protein
MGSYIFADCKTDDALDFDKWGYHPDVRTISKKIVPMYAHMVDVITALSDYGIEVSVYDPITQKRFGRSNS